VILPGILLRILLGILLGVLSGILSGILLGVLPGILLGILRGILPGIPLIMRALLASQRSVPVTAVETTAQVSSSSIVLDWSRILR
jgi:hypothetical protein